MAHVVVGTSGWNYPHWRARFYPRDLLPSRWLAYYAERFPTVEVNNTFYRLPDARVFGAWREAVSGSFMFALKASRFITHIRRLRFSRRPVQRLLTRARALRRGLGPILFQLPPTFQRNDARLAAFLTGLPAGQRYVVEFRHDSWHSDPVYELMRRHQVACCISDGDGIPLRLVKTARFVYARLHGPAGIGEGRYHDAALRRWAGRLRELSGRDAAYVYFNNDQEGHAVANAARLAELLERP